MATPPLTLLYLCSLRYRIPGKPDANRRLTMPDVGLAKWSRLVSGRKIGRFWTEKGHGRLLEFPFHLPQAMAIVLNGDGWSEGTLEPRRKNAFHGQPAVLSFTRRSSDRDQTALVDYTLCPDIKKLGTVTLTVHCYKFHHQHGEGLVLPTFARLLGKCLRLLRIFSLTKLSTIRGVKISTVGNVHYGFSSRKYTNKLFTNQTLSK